jgi:hypothetical protein
MVNHCFELVNNEMVKYVVSPRGLIDPAVKKGGATPWEATLAGWWF